jgi:hypothetical protein
MFPLEKGGVSLKSDDLLYYQAAVSTPSPSAHHLMITPHHLLPLARTIEADGDIYSVTQYWREST